MIKVVYSFLVFSLLSIQVSYGQTVTGDSWSQVRATGSGRLACVYYPTPGLVYEESGQVKGVCADILADFKQFVYDKYGKTVEIDFVAKETIWPEFLDRTLSGTQTLGVANVTITEERKQTMKFSPPFIENPLILLTHSSAPNVTSMDQLSSTLEGYTALAITGSTHVEVMESIKAKYFPSLKIVYATSGIEVLQRLQSDPKLFSILDFTEYFDAVRNKMPIKRQNVEISGPQAQLGFIMPKNSDWQPLWNEFLTPAYRQSIGYKKIIANNLGNAFLGMLSGK